MSSELDDEPQEADADWAEAWAKELDARAEAVEDGTAVLLDWEEVSQDILAELQSRRRNDGTPPAE